MRTKSLLLLLALLAACAKPAAEKTQLGQLSVTARIDPDPPTTGENQLLLTIRNAEGKPVDDAAIDFTYDMPAMGAMSEMKGGGTLRKKGGGEYEITYPLAMQGDWTLTLAVTTPGQAPAELRMKVAPPHKGFVIEKSAAEAEPMGAMPGMEHGGAPMLEIPPQRQQLIGVTFGAVERRPLAVEIRAPGRVEVDETRLSVVTLKYDAYVEKLLVSQTGQAVKTGQPLLTLYSPDLLSAEQDYLIAAKNAGVGGGAELLEAATRRLALWDLSAAQIAALRRSGKAEARVTIVAPASGVVLEKNVVEGTRAMAGTPLYRIGNLGQIWVQTDLFEGDAALVSVGQPATLSAPWRSGDTMEGRVEFLYPTIDEQTRSLRARLSFANPKLFLRPGMYVDVTIQVPLGERLSVPDAALLVSGEHRYVFVDWGHGKLQPTEVKIGEHAGEFDEVLGGVEPNQRVVLNGNFLLSSEAQLRNALPRWSAP